MDRGDRSLASWSRGSSSSRGGTFAGASGTRRRRRSVWGDARSGVAMAVQRLQKELKLLNREPLPGIVARPNPKNLLEWHYVLTGDEASDHAGGSFHGKVTFPSQYPFRPPDVVMVTPSGRFAPNTRICMSMTSFHPESWNPMWSVSSILAGLQSFFYESTGTTGSVTTSRAEKRRLAAASMAFNVKKCILSKSLPGPRRGTRGEGGGGGEGGGDPAETQHDANVAETRRRPGDDACRRRTRRGARRKPSKRRAGIPHDVRGDHRRRRRGRPVGVDGRADVRTLATRVTRRPPTSAS